MANVKAILGEKLGMTQVFTDEGRAIPVTVVQAGPCVVAQIRTPDRDGYAAVQLGFGEIKESRVTKPMKGHFGKGGVAPARHLVEVRTDDASEYEVGSHVTVEKFAAGEHVDVIGVSKGKGFAGVMKRHNFHGKPDSHGTERKHRSTGSVGAGTTPGRVFKGMKGPGHLGHDRTTILSLEVIESDAERNLLLIKGAIPGPTGALVMIRNAVKRSAK
ncbi:MAG TPA: 50S ribosomal protein L3 [Actinomycetota bacterium]|nr:50S ribosomal protein L3 [Actinomycetota bacterium]